MKKVILIFILTQFSLLEFGQIIADHTVVDQFDKIPQQYIDEVKKMWLVVAGESHSQAYRDGLAALASAYPTYAVSVTESGTPEPYTTNNLRVSRSTWGDIDHTTGWIYTYGEEDWWTTKTAENRTKSGIGYCNSHSLTIGAMGFGWCWDAQGGMPSSTADPVYGVHWYGWSEGVGYLPWGLDAGDLTMCNNSISLDTYIAATQGYIDYCAANSIPTKVFFTTGPVDNTSSGAEGYGTGEIGYQAYLKWEHIRDYVDAHPSTVLFDYADILCWDNNGNQTTTKWNGHTYPTGTNANTGAEETGHITNVGALRLAKAMWWMLARMAGWDGGSAKIPVTGITISGTGEATTISTDNGTLQLIADITPTNATNKTVTWSIQNGTGRAIISASGLVTAIANGMVAVRATTNDGSGIFGTIVITIYNQIIPVTNIDITSADGTSIISSDKSTLQLNATITPTDANNKTVTWTLQNGTGQAMISSSGLVTAISDGSVTAIATANDGSGVFGTFIIKITNQTIPVKSITVTGADGTSSILTDNGTLQLRADVNPTNASDKTVLWNMQDGTGQAVISSSGLVVAISNGTVTAMATANDGSGVIGTLVISISNQIIPISNITVTATGGASTISTDHGTLQLSAAVLPDDATNKTFTWSVQNATGQASISTTGLVTAIANGTVIAKATANDGSSVFGSLTILISNQVIPPFYIPLDSLFRTEIPISYASDSRYELGSVFQTLSEGFITKARLYSNVNEGGDHIARLWVLNGSVYSLAAGPFTWNFSAGVQGWRSFTFPSPIAVNANQTYIISISNSTDRYYVKRGAFSSTANSPYVKYQKGVYSTTLGTVPVSTANNCYFRDVVFALPDDAILLPGAIGVSQTICFNTSPAPLTQLIAPAGGTGSYSYQWQSSADNTTWTNIPGATFLGYTPPILKSSTYYRRTITSGSFNQVPSDPILIKVSSQITLAQLHDNISIANNTATNFYISITGGSSPYTINYTRNTLGQPLINNYFSGVNIPTGTLNTGSYTYILTSVKDAYECTALNLGTPINITVNKDHSYIPLDSLFRTEVPASYASDSRYELGSVFQTLSDGFITKARLYSNVNEGGDHIVRLWILNGSVYSLAAGPFTWNFSAGVQGWRSFTFPSPIAVNANQTYIISISNSTDRYYVKRGAFTSTANGSYVRYQKGVYSTTLGTVPVSIANNCYFRDVVFALQDDAILLPGTIGVSQTICFNTSPAPLTQLTAPAGGTGSYSYQWQSSADNTTWTNIPGATFLGYTPPILKSSTYYRRTITSGSFNQVPSDPILIKVSSQITLAQLHDNISIANNTATNFYISITGGSSPYTINYTRNTLGQPLINNYFSGVNIPTGTLNTGSYTYILTSVKDAYECTALNLGTPINITVNKDHSYIPLDSLFRTEVPASYASDSRYELGSVFQTLSDGFITKARLYSNVNEGGDHIVRLWILNGSVYSLAAGPFTWNFSAGVQGWRSFTFPSPIAVNANQTYIISISNSTDRYYVKRGAFTSTANGSYVRYQKGVYSTTLGTVPVSIANNCYFRDVVFALQDDAILLPGTIGINISTYLNTKSTILSELTAPSGGTGKYSFQWQSSKDNITWKDISGAAFSSYVPPVRESGIYYRRNVMSGNLNPAYGDPVLISGTSQIVPLQHNNSLVNDNPNSSSDNAYLIKEIQINLVSESTTFNTNSRKIHLSAEILPSDAKSKSVTWLIINGTGEASIDSTGLLTIFKNGNVTAVATANDGSNISGSLILSLDNPTNLNSFSITENPEIKVYQLLDKLVIQSNYNITDYSYAIYSVSGILMSRKRFESNEEIIDVSSFPRGIYIITFITNKSFEPVKFIIQ